MRLLLGGAGRVGAVVAVAMAVLAAHAWRYWPFISDDALISLRYAARLIEAKGLTWTDGERVEGYSNLLWVLATAALGFLGMDLIDAARLLGFAGMTFAIAAVAIAHRPADDGAPPPAWLPALVPALALAISGPIAVWAIGGLEQAAVAALIAWALLLARPLVDGPAPDALRRGAPLALLCLARPDGPLLVAAFAGAVATARGLGRAALADAARLTVLPVLAVAGQLAFRLFYYGDWVPNTGRVKLGFSDTRALEGARYVGTGLLQLGGLTGLAVLAAVPAAVDAAHRRRVLLYVAPALAWSGYVIAIGGDHIFAARRQLVPVIVLAAFLAGEGLAWARARGGRAWTPAAVAGVVALAVLAPMQWRDRENVRAILERFEWRGQAVGLFLKAAFGPQQPLLAVDTGGSLPFFSRLPALDMLGLNDAWLTRHPPATFGRGAIGHELGDGPYVLSRRPDLVVFCGPEGRAHGCFRSGRQLMALPAFAADYVLVRFKGREPLPYASLIWVRREGRVGVVRGPARVIVPGHLLTGRGETIATLDRTAVVALVTPDVAVRLEGLPLRAGAWTITAEPSGGVQLHVAAAGRTLAGPAPGPLALEADGAPVTIEVRAPEGTVGLASVILDGAGAGASGARQGGEKPRQK